jgi:murein DD-endopeptidase MepM/ murein hydrolase activator NlpD
MIGALVLVASLAAGCVPPPVDAPVAVPFRQPACRWCPGHRGLEFRTEPGAPVRAVAPGVVAFAGRVAGTLYVVVLHADGVRATYGMLATSAPTRGDVVLRGALVGRAGPRVYFGLRALDGSPIDPTPLLGREVARPRLVPTDGTPGRHAGDSRTVCALSADRLARAP